jgi:hypothetical protein
MWWKNARINSKVFGQNISDAARVLPTKRVWQSIFIKAEIKKKVRPCGFYFNLVQGQ